MIKTEDCVIDDRKVVPRFLAVLEELDMNQTEIAHEFECNASYISNIITYRRDLSRELGAFLSMKYRISMDWLFRGIGNMYIADNSDTKKGRVIYIPLAVRAGFFSHFGDEAFIEANCEYFTHPDLKHGTYYAMKVEGESMEPLIRHNAMLYMQPPLESLNEIKEGFVYMVDAKEGLVVKRLYINREKKNTFIFKSDNEEFRPYDVAAADINKVLPVIKYESEYLNKIR